MDESRDWLAIQNAMLRYYLHIADPDSLSNEEWAAQVKLLEWIRRKESGN